MKKSKNSSKSSIDLEALKTWQKLSTKARLDWLESALRFGKLRKF
jgi:hypothetical protein